MAQMCNNRINCGYIHTKKYCIAIKMNELNL